MALGKGLSSLIQPKAVEKITAQTATTPGIPFNEKDMILHIPVGKIESNPLQPRNVFNESELSDLANSIKENGILQPIIVTPLKQPKGIVEYQIVAGERRWRAAKLAKLSEVPAIVRDITRDYENLELAILENVQRKDLNPIELALSYKKLADYFDMTHNDIAQKMGKSREHVSNTIRLLGLPAPIQEDLRAGGISENHARAILALPTDELKMKLWQEVKDQKLSARNTEVAARKYKKIPSKSAADLDAFSKGVVVELESYLGTKVMIEPGKHVSDGGKIIIKYFSNEDLKNVVNKITKRS